MSRRALAAWLWTAAILLACWTPKVRLPVDEGSAGRKIPHLDKVVHFALFAGFGALWMAARRSCGVEGTAAVLAAGTALAVGSELGQMMPWVNRDAGVLDALADLAGLVAGVGALAALPPRRPASGGEAPDARQESDSAHVDLSRGADHHDPAGPREADAPRRLGASTGTGRG